MTTRTGQRTHARRPLGDLIRIWLVGLLAAATAVAGAAPAFAGAGTATLSGTVTGPAGAVTTLYVWSDTGSWSTDTSDGTWELLGLPDGEYLVYAMTTHDGVVWGAYHGGVTRQEAIPVVVDGADVTDVDVTMYASGAITGTVRTQADVDDDWEVIVLAHRWIDALGQWDVVAQTRTSGSYVLGGGLGNGADPFELPVGRYLVSFTAADPGHHPFCDQWYGLSTTMAGATPVDVTLGAATTGIDAELMLQADDCTYPQVLAGNPVITGTAQVGQTLAVDPGQWEPQPVELAYQWTVDGVAIDGATDDTYTPTTDDLGKILAVDVTGTRPGRTAVTRTAVLDGPVTDVLVARTPVVTGHAVVGGTLTADAGDWGPAPVELAYQWAADGVAITGADAATYVPTTSDVGKRLTVQVTGSKTFHTTASRTSEPTAKVVAPTVQAIGDLVPGKGVGVTGAGFVPGEHIRLELHSDPVHLADVTADAQGAFEVDVTIPADVPPGDHTIVALRTDGSTASTDAVVVSPSPTAPEAAPVTPAVLARTGADSLRGGLTLGGLLLTAGLALTALRRRRTT